MIRQSLGAPTILVIDETPPVVRLIELELGFQGYRTESVLIAEDAVGTARRVRPSAIVLGAQIPTPVLFQTLSLLSAQVECPIIFVNSGGNDADTALALQNGASDVIDRPFTPEELSLRLQALLNAEVREASVINRGRLTIDVLHRIVLLGERKLSISSNEWGLLLALSTEELAMEPKRLLATVWGEEYKNELHFLELWIHRLRVNIGDDPSSPEIVLGDLNTGYFLAD